MFPLYLFSFLSSSSFLPHSFPLHILFLLPASSSSPVQYELILKNMAKLMTNFSLAKWEMVQSTAAVSDVSTYLLPPHNKESDLSPLSPLQYDLLKNETCDNLVLRLNGRVKGVGAKEVFEKITNYPARPKWDFMCK